MAFKSLVCAVSVQCQEIKQALTSISYFDIWDSDVIAECCRVSSIAEYPPDKIILGPDIGTSHTVYFILEGVCKMVQTLLVEVKTNSDGKALYKLHRLFDSRTSHSKSTSEGYSSKLFNQMYEAVKMSNNSGQAGNSQTTVLSSDIGGEIAAKDNEEEEKGKSRKDSQVEESNTDGTTDENVLTESNTQSQVEIPTKVDNTEVKPEEKPAEDSKAKPVGPEGTEAIQESEPKKEFVFEPDYHLKVLEECKKRGKETTEVCKKGSIPEKPRNAECFFVQTGFLHKGACFGLDKCQSENFIMSTAKVKCLKIPRRFLFKHNPYYTWNRIRLFQSLYLPKDEVIFERLRSDRLWIRDRRKLSVEIASSRNISNYTLINEVPFSIRLTEVQ